MVQGHETQVFALTPLSDAVEAYVREGRARFHMPGHKGALPYFDGLARFDLSEVDGCDSLYEASFAIRDTEAAYSELYQSAASFLSAGGSTLCIQAMLALAAKPGDRVVCGRGCHAAAINAMALLDLEPVWVFPEVDEATGLAEAVTALQIREILAGNPGASAVYVTSPDYYGRMCDIRAISGVCREFGLPLLADNAHGAHLRFLEPSKHPINLGADMCCDSLHKTLPVLTGGAMLHIGNRKYVPDAKRCMSIFGSTSPSYLIMLSADRALAGLSGDFPERLAATASLVKGLENLAGQRGFAIPGGERDPLRLALGFGAMGWGREEFSRLIRKAGIEPEMIAETFCVLMASPSNTRRDFERLESFILSLPVGEPVPAEPVGIIRPRRAMSPREALFAPWEEVPAQHAAGRIAGASACPCPPGIPVVVPGEVVPENLARAFKKYGISRLNVLKLNYDKKSIGND